MGSQAGRFPKGAHVGGDFDYDDSTADRAESDYSGWWLCTTRTATSPKDGYAYCVGWCLWLRNSTAGTERSVVWPGGCTSYGGMGTECASAVSSDFATSGDRRCLFGFHSS